MFLIVGLGNPGAEYQNTRHNVGFMVADEIHEEYHFGPYKAKFDGLISEGTIEGEKVYLLKPQTYMNLSGAGGHNGLKSIDAQISPNYNRVRLGIGHPDSSLPHEAVVNHVLTGFSKADKAILDENIRLVTENIGVVLKDGIAAFSNKIGNLLKNNAK